MSSRIARSATLVVPLALTSAAPPGGATIFVDDDTCPGRGDGSMGNPYCSIQTAIDSAAAMDEIVVAEGTYLEAIDFLGKAVTLRSTNPMDPAVVANTIIDGSSHVVQCVSGEGANTDCQPLYLR